MSPRNATGYDWRRVAEVETILVQTFKDSGFDVFDSHGHPCAYPLVYDGDGDIVERNAIDLHLLARTLEERLS
jgi:hypothetical protein